MGTGMRTCCEFLILKARRRVLLYGTSKDFKTCRVSSNVAWRDSIAKRDQQPCGYRVASLGFCAQAKHLPNAP
jgi:hypothetical protein